MRPSASPTQVRDHGRHRRRRPRLRAVSAHAVRRAAPRGSRADADGPRRGAALLVAALSSELVASQGAVIALGDAGVTRPYENHVAYLTAKGALQTGLRALAVELAPHVRINIVALGIVADPEADADPLRTHRLATRSPLGRFGTPDEVAHVVLALLDATWATGEIWGIGR